MSTDRDTTRIVRSWLEDGVTALPDRVLDAVLDQVPSTPQRRSWWPSRRTSFMSSYAKLAIAGGAVLVVAVFGYSLIPRTGGAGGPPLATAIPSASPAPIAIGSFISRGAQTELNATGEGSNVTGTLTVSDSSGDAPGGFTVDLGCTRTTDSGLILIGGLVTESTNFDEYAPEGTRVAIVFQRGAPVTSLFWFEQPDPPAATCAGFLDGIPDVGDSRLKPSDLEPIEGTVELRP